MTVVETVPFLRDAKKKLSDDERAELVIFLASNPEAGDVLEGTGGVRKVRWARQGGGKSGGFRVIHFFHSSFMPLYILALYGKNEKSNLNVADRNELKKLTAMLVDCHERGKS